MSKSEINDFKVNNASASQKFRVSEDKGDGSATSRFLQNMEKVRKNKVCNYIIDMSGKAPGIITEYGYQGRTFYLDTRSLAIFKQGLKEHNNVFTLGTYEAITEGRHTYKYQRKQAEQADTNSKHNVFAKTEQVKKSKKREILEVSGKYCPDILPLGYYLRRREPRLLHIMPIKMIYDGVTYELKSKDFSLNGLQAYISASSSFFQAPKKVRITFSKFYNDTREIVGGTRAEVFKNVEYIIKNVQISGDKLYLSMVQQNLSEEAKNYFQNFMDTNRSRYKFDASDLLQASKAKLCEHLYTHNSVHLPVFITWNKAGGFKVDAIIRSGKNQMFFDFVSKNQLKPDLLPLLLPHRVHRLAHLARNDQGALLFLYWENDRLYSAFDFEYKRPAEIAEIAIKTKAQSGMVFKITDNLNKKPHHEKMSAMFESIKKLEPSVSEMIKTRIKETIAQFILTDISHDFFHDRFYSELKQFEVVPSSNVLIWTGCQQVSLLSGERIKEIESNQIKIPEIVDLKVIPQRNNDRYKYKMEIDVRSAESVYQGETVDFSLNGLGIILPQDTPLVKNDRVEISFLTLMNRNIDVCLENITFRIMFTKQQKDGLFLGLERCVDECSDDINAFFVDLVNRNKEKLALCFKDKIERVNILFYEAYVTENIQAIPIIIGDDSNEGRYVREVGLTEVSCALAEIFYRRDYGYDLSLLTSDIRLKEFYTRTVRRTKKNNQSFMIYLYKETEVDTDEQYIVSIAEFEIKDKKKLQLLIDKILKEGGSCIKVQFVNQLTIDETFTSSIVNEVVDLNRTEGLKFDAQIKDIIGLADMVDLTDEYRFFKQLSQC